MTRGSMEVRFRARLDELGAVPLWREWRGAKQPHLVRCVNDHLCSPRPNNVVYKRQGPCKDCSTRPTPSAARQAFHERLRGFEAVPLQDEWLGANVPHLIRCKWGHETRVRPRSLQQGQGPCWECAKRPGRWGSVRVIDALIDRTDFKNEEAESVKELRRVGRL